MLANWIPEGIDARNVPVKRNAPSLRESLPCIYRRLQELAQAERALAHHWPSGGPVVLRWDENRQVLATDSALGTYRAIYGNDLMRGMRYIWSSARRRWRGEGRGESPNPLRIDTPLPRDAIVIPQRSQDRAGTPFVLTVVSAREQCVVKFFLKERKSRFESELNAWRVAQAAGVAHRLAEVLSSGESPNGLSWLVTRLVRNNAANPPVIGNWWWRRFLLTELLPELKRFYERSGLELISGGVWLTRFRAKLAAHPLGVQLQRLADVAEAAARRTGDDRLPFALIHGDLRPHNVHRYAGQWWLIDWSMSRRAPIMIDLWPNSVDALASQAFSGWLHGHGGIDAVPRNSRVSMDTYAKWQSSLSGIRLDEDGLRFHALATLLHRLSRNPGKRSALSIATFNSLHIQE